MLNKKVYESRIVDVFVCTAWKSTRGWVEERIEMMMREYEFFMVADDDGGEMKTDAHKYMLFKIYFFIFMHSTKILQKWGFFSPAIAQKSLLNFIDIFFLAALFFILTKRHNFLHKNINYKKICAFLYKRDFF